MLIPRQPAPRRQMAGFWDDNLDVPTVDLSSSSGVYDAADAWAQGTGTPPVDTTILDANDAWAQNGGAPVFSAGDTTSSGSSWSFSDLLHTGTGIAQELLRYRTATLPGGQRIYTRVDPYTGQAVTGGRTVMLPAGGAMDFIRQNAVPLALLAGAAVLLANGRN